MSKKQVVGKTATVIDRNSWFFGYWGTIIDVDEDGQITLAILNSKDSLPVFDRDQIRIKRK